MGPEINVSVPDMATKITDVLFFYQQNRILCDCRIQCCDGEVYAHKIVLAMWGFHGFYINSINTITALEYSAVLVNKFMKLIYYGKILVTLEEALSMSNFGNHIGIKLNVSVLSGSCSTVNISLEDSLKYFMLHNNPMVKSGILHIRYEPSYNWNIVTSTNARREEPERGILSNCGSAAEAVNFSDGAVTMVTDVKEESQEEDVDVSSFDLSSSIQHSEGSSGGSLTVSVNDDTQQVVSDEKHEEGQMFLDFGAEMIENLKGVDCNEENANSSFDCAESSYHVDELKKLSESKHHNDSGKTIDGKVKTKESRSNFRKCKHCLKMKVENPFVYRYDTTEGKEQFTRHCLQSHDLALSTNVSCDICGFVYKRCYSETYVDHKVRKHGYTEYDPAIFTKKECEYENCKFWALCRIKLKTHQGKVHATESVVCNLCGAVMKHRDTLRGHIQLMHQSRILHQCEVCGKTLASATSLRKHIEIQHEKKSPKPQGFCSYCNQSFKTKSTYLMHMYRDHGEIPHGTKVYRCDECDYLAFNKNMFKGHELRHKALKGHVMEKNKECHVCGRKFVSKQNLKDHVRRAHITKVYCPYEGCGKFYPGKANLQMHITCAHEKVRNFSCHACPYKCTSHGNLVKHLRGVHKEEVSTMHTRRIQAMLSGKGYLEATSKRPVTDRPREGEEGANPDRRVEVTENNQDSDGHREEGANPDRNEEVTENNQDSDDTTEK